MIDFCPSSTQTDEVPKGVYFEIVVNSTSSVFLLLQNSPMARSSAVSDASSVSARSLPNENFGHLSFQASTLPNLPAESVSLLARIDEEEYILFPNASSIVQIRSGDLNPNEVHKIRVIAPMLDDEEQGIVQLEGLWLDKGGRLLGVDDFHLGMEVEEEDSSDAENENVGKEHRLALSQLWSGGGRNEHNSDEKNSENEDSEHESQLVRTRNRVLEIITDAPGGSRGDSSGGKIGPDTLLNGVRGWEYRVGEIFRANHVVVGIDGVCLTENCIGGTGEPAGMGDVFFRR